MGCQPGIDLCNVADQKAHQIDHVRTVVTEDAAGPVRVKTPGIGRVATVAGHEAEVGVLEPTNRALCNQIAQIAIVGQPAVGEVGHVAHALRFGTLVHLPGVIGIARQRLFAEHMQPGIERGHRHGKMLVIRCQLKASGEGDHIRRRHFTTYLELVRTADTQLRGAAAAAWYTRLDAELENIRAAWEWALTTEHFVDAAWLGVALSHFWSVRLHFQEATFWLEQLLPHRHHLPPDLRLATLLTLYHVWRGNDNFQAIDRYMAELLELQRTSTNPCLPAIAWRCMGVATADFVQAVNCWEQCIGLLRAVDDASPIDHTYGAYGDSVYQLAFALFRYAIRLIDVGDYGAAERLSTESLALFRRRDNRDYIVAPLGNLGRLALLRGDLPQARLLLQEAVAIARSIGNVLGLIDWLPRLGVVTLSGGDAAEAQRLLHESLHLSRTINSSMYLAWNFTYLAETALWQGDLDQAAHWLAQALAHHANPRWIRTELVDCLWMAARLATVQQQYLRAATLFGLAKQVGSRIGYVPAGPVNEAALVTVGERLGEAAFAEAFAAGQAMTLAEAFTTMLDLSS